MADTSDNLPERPCLDYVREHAKDVTAALGEAILKDDPALATATADDGMTALHYAACAGNRDLARILLRHEADVEARDVRGNSALVHASHGGPWKPKCDDVTVELLLRHHAEVDLFSAAMIGRTDLIAAQLEQHGHAIDALDRHGKTALWHAAHNDQFDAVKFLVERGADVSLSDPVGTAALHRTSQQCSDELIKFLIASGADAHLCCHVACGDEEGTRRALEQNPDAANQIVYEFDAKGYAIHSGQLGTLRILLQHGCRLSEQDRREIRRIYANRQEIIDELLV